MAWGYAVSTLTEGYTLALPDDETPFTSTHFNVPEMNVAVGSWDVSKLAPGVVSWTFVDRDVRLRRYLEDGGPWTADCGQLIVFEPDVSASSSPAIITTTTVVPPQAFLPLPPSHRIIMGVHDTDKHVTTTATRSVSESMANKARYKLRR